MVFAHAAVEKDPQIGAKPHSIRHPGYVDRLDSQSITNETRFLASFIPDNSCPSAVHIPERTRSRSLECVEDILGDQIGPASNLAETEVLSMEDALITPHRWHFAIIISKRGTDCVRLRLRYNKEIIPPPFCSADSRGPDEGILQPRIIRRNKS